MDICPKNKDNAMRSAYTPCIINKYLKSNESIYNVYENKLNFTMNVCMNSNLKQKAYSCLVLPFPLLPFFLSCFFSFLSLPFSFFFFLFLSFSPLSLSLFSFLSFSFPFFSCTPFTYAGGLWLTPTCGQWAVLSAALTIRYCRGSCRG